jgi:hypothetical protein
MSRRIILRDYRGETFVVSSIRLEPVPRAGASNVVIVRRRKRGYNRFLAVSGDRIVAGDRCKKASREPGRCVCLLMSTSRSDRRQPLICEEPMA